MTSVEQVGQEVTGRNLNIQPTLTARQALPVRIIVNHDLVLRPYQPLFSTEGFAIGVTDTASWAVAPRRKVSN